MPFRVYFLKVENGETQPNNNNKRKKTTQIYRAMKVGSGRMFYCFKFIATVRFSKWQ